jgi:hypothetical protein
MMWFGEGLCLSILLGLLLLLLRSISCGICVQIAWDTFLSLGVFGGTCFWA